jgi:competence protein ComEC
MYRPLIPILLSYLSGLLICYYLPIPQFILLPGIFLSLIFFIHTIITRAHRLSLILAIILFALIGILYLKGILSPHLSPNHITHYVTGEKVVLEGVLYKPPELFPDKTRLYLQTEKIIEHKKIIIIKGRLLLTIKEKLYAFNYGDRVRFSAKLRFPRNFNNPGRFDYNRYLALKGILVIASLYDGKTIVKVGRTVPNPLLLQGEHYRTQIRNFLRAHLTSPEADIARALILGEKGGIAKELREQFSATGVAHILAISGLHVGIIALVSFFLVKNLLKCSTWLLLATDISKVAALLTLVPVMSYWFIAGYGPGTTRATIMVITYLIAIIIGKQEDVWNTLAFAAFIILIFSPSSLFDISFQLSFISVMAILYLTPHLSRGVLQHTPDPLEGTPPWWKKIARKITLFLMVTISALVGTAPIVAFYFHRLSPWGWLTNLIIIPLIGFLVVPLGLLTSLLVFLFQPLAIYTTQMMKALIQFALFVVNCFTTLPYADYRTTTPTLFEMGLFYLGVFFLVNRKQSSIARYGLVLISIAFMVNQSFWYYQNTRNSHLRITSFDVGQGEATLVQLPHGKTMLIDGGGFYNNSFDLGEKVVAPALWKKKIKHIDIVVLSHPHPDHLNGLVYIVKNFTIQEVWTNGEKVRSEPFEEFVRTIVKKGIKKFVLTREVAHRTVNGVGVEVLHPPASPRHNPSKRYPEDINNHSLVIRLTYKDITLLLTGDISREVERDLIQTVPYLKSTILKVPHHGSATSSSSAFLKQVQPEIALLSLGYANIFHLPHPDVLKRYHDQGCQLYRTDRDGAITIESDGSSIRIKTFLNLRKKIVRSHG